MNALISVYHWAISRTRRLFNPLSPGTVSSVHSSALKCSKAPVAYRFRALTSSTRHIRPSLTHLAFFYFSMLSLSSNTRLLVTPAASQIISHLGIFAPPSLCLGYFPPPSSSWLTWSKHLHFQEAFLTAPWPTQCS